MKHCIPLIILAVLTVETVLQQTLEQNLFSDNNSITNSIQKVNAQTTMEKFDVEIMRTARQFKTITVEAQSLEQAQTLALDQAGDHEFPGEKSADYAIAGQLGIDREKVTRQIVEMFFINGDDAYEQYLELKALSAKGNGHSIAANHAEINPCFIGSPIDEVLENIDHNVNGVIEIITEQQNN